MVLLTSYVRGSEGTLGFVEVGFTAFGGLSRTVVMLKMEFII